MKSTRVRLGGFLIAAFALAGCGAVSSGDEEASDEAAAALTVEVDDDLSAVPWQTLGTGVSAKSIGSGKNVLIVYGGYTAQDVYSQRWASALYRAKGDALDVGHIVAVRGPNQSGYANREIANSKLVAYLESNGRAANADSIIVVAHSSGTYVANELFSQLSVNRAGSVPAGTLHKVTLMNLDGGGLDDSALGSHGIAAAYFVYACDQGRCSHNASGMRALGQSHASLGGAFRVNADGSGCSRSRAGGLWCLHDALITTHPHNPNMYDLARDYTDFTSTRTVVTSYLDVLSR